MLKSLMKFPVLNIDFENSLLPFFLITLFSLIQKIVYLYNSRKSGKETTFSDVKIHVPIIVLLLFGLNIFLFKNKFTVPIKLICFISFLLFSEEFVWKGNYLIQRIIVVMGIFAIGFTSIHYVQSNKTQESAQEKEANYVMVDQVRQVEKNITYKSFGFLTRPKKEIVMPQEFSKIEMIIPATQTTVKKGDLVIKFDTKKLEWDLKTAEAELKAASEKMENFKAFKGIASAQERIETQKVIEQSKAKCEEIKIRIAEASFFADDDYFVHHYFITPGQVFSKQKLLTLYKMNDLHFETHINPVSMDFKIGELEKIKSAYVLINNERIPAEFLYADKVCEEPLTSSFKVVLKISDEKVARSLYQSQSTCDCKIIFEKTKTMYKLPESSIQAKRGKNTVFAIKNDQVVGVEVNVLYTSSDGYVYLDTASLQPGQVVVSEGAGKLSDLAKVIVLKRGAEDER